MKRRDFVKTGICLGCIGAIGSGVNSLCNKFMSEQKVLSDVGLANLIKSFQYKTEEELPTQIKLDICNLCQLNCAACWMRKDEELVKKEAGGFGYVSFETFKDFIDKHPFIRQIELSHNGEIFLNPDLEDIIRYSYEKGIDLTAGSGVNLNTLSERIAEALVKYKFNNMTVSIDGATPETYAIYRRGGDFNTVINNIKMINKYKEKYNSDYPFMTYKFILFGHNEHEIEQAKILAKDLNMNIKFDVNAVKEYSPLKHKKESFKLAGIREADSNLDNNLNKYKNGEFNWFFCTDMYDCPQFNWNGDLFGCCTLYLKTFGTNLFRDGLLKSLNNEKFIYAKMMLSNFSIPPKKDVPCSECFIYKYLKRKNYPIEKSII